MLSTAASKYRFVLQGADMMKHGRQGKPKMHYFRLGEGDNDLTWRSAKGATRSVSLWTVRKASFPLSCHGISRTVISSIVLTKLQDHLKHKNTGKIQGISFVVTAIAFFVVGSKYLAN